MSTRLADQLLTHWEALARTYFNPRWIGRLHESLPVRLTPGQIRALSLLAEGGEPRLRGLAGRLGLDDSTVSRLVDRLEALGLVERRPARTDRRAIELGLTELGTDVVAQVRSHRRAFLAELLDALDPGERREFVRLFGVVAARLREGAEAEVAP